ncbi:centromere protein O [Heliangelus exortis]|uniref:centromere protein O n=1 Tax=Heliangelus exortis TaxID=472823 RepID=UPI003A929785
MEEEKESSPDDLQEALPEEHQELLVQPPQCLRGEEAPGRAAPGLFAHLEMLEKQAHEAAMKEEAAEQQEKKLSRLKSRVQELRLQRDQLREKVEQQEQPGKGGAASAPAQPSARAVLEWKIKSLKSMLQLFYLTGISGKLTKQGVCFCISTAYEGTYLDFYYLDLLTKPAVRIHRHSIPTFIPLEQISKKFLQTDIRRFLALLSDHLNAYVGRRHQAEQLQEHFSDQIVGTMQRNSLCNLLVFNYKVLIDKQPFQLSARLLYGDLCSRLPTQVTISSTEDSPTSLAETAAAHSDLLRRVALHKAFPSLLSTQGAP